jgi:hypothetical protein
MRTTQPSTLRRRISIACAAAAAAAAAAAPAAATTAAAGPVGLSPAITRAPTELTLDLDPSALAPAASSAATPSSIALSLPRGMALHLGARRRLCTAAEAVALSCPSASNIGFGHGVVQVAGYLDPGGEADVVSYVKAYLEAPLQPGDPASIAFEVQLLGVDRIQQAIEQNFGIDVRFDTEVSARVERLRSGPYGLEVWLGGLPGGISLPPAVAGQGVSVRFTRLRLQLGAVRLHRVAFTHTFRFATPGGPRVVRVADHRLVARYLLTDPPACRGSWPFELQLTGPGASGTVVDHVPCHRAAVPMIPPPSPSAPQGA